MPVSQSRSLGGKNPSNRLIKAVDELWYSEYYRDLDYLDEPGIWEGLRK